MIFLIYLVKKKNKKKFENFKLKLIFLNEFVNSTSFYLISNFFAKLQSNKINNLFLRGSSYAISNKTTIYINFNEKLSKILF